MPRKFTTLGLSFGAASLLVPAFAVYHHSALSQQAYTASNQEQAHLSWAMAESAPVDSEEAIARAQQCIIARNRDMTPSSTIFNRKFAFDSPEDAQSQEGRFYCALDGSTIQIINGRADLPVKVAPEDMDQYYSLLIDHHNVDAQQILDFKAEFSGRENREQVK